MFVLTGVAVGVVETTLGNGCDSVLRQEGDNGDGDMCVLVVVFVADFAMSLNLEGERERDRLRAWKPAETSTCRGCVGEGRVKVPPVSDMVILSDFEDDDADADDARNPQ